MAEMVAAFASSHSVMLTCTLQDWQKGFRTFDPKGHFYDRQGNVVTYQQLLALAPSNAKDLVTDEAIEKRWRQVQDAMARMRAEVQAANLDVLIICGDDQNELFSKNLQPAMGIYHGKSIRNGKKKQLPQDDFTWYKHAQNQRLEDSDDISYPCNEELALHLIHGLIEEGFDIASLGGVPDGKYEGHAYSFMHKKYGVATPIVPIFLNTYYPPNQPTPRRCVDFGRVIGKLVASFPQTMRVGFMASGGLSHFQAEEDLDDAVIDAMKRKDLDFLSNLDVKRLQAGSSEIRNWLVLAGACQNLDMNWISYAPGYRTDALTGTGLGFATFYPQGSGLAQAAE